MRGLIAGLTVFPAQVFAHPGTGFHVHDLGIEHGLLLAVVLAFLVYAVKK